MFKRSSNKVRGAVFCCCCCCLLRLLPLLLLALSPLVSCGVCLLFVSSSFLALSLFAYFLSFAVCSFRLLLSVVGAVVCLCLSLSCCCISLSPAPVPLNLLLLLLLLCVCVCCCSLCINPKSFSSRDWGVLPLLQRHLPVGPTVPEALRLLKQRPPLPVAPAAAVPAAAAAAAASAAAKPSRHQQTSGKPDDATTHFLLFIWVYIQLHVTPFCCYCCCCCCCRYLSSGRGEGYGCLCCRQKRRRCGVVSPCSSLCGRQQLQQQQQRRRRAAAAATTTTAAATGCGGEAGSKD